MARYLAIDYGSKRCGIAVSDPLKIIATALETISTDKCLSYIESYCAEEEVESFVLGLPTHADGSDLEITEPIRVFGNKLKTTFDKPVFFVDERYTSKMAAEAMVKANFKKKDRRNKENLDKISAVLILRSFMENNI